MRYTTLSATVALIALFGMSVLVGGCDSSAATAVAITGGAAAATVFGSQAATGSSITVNVDSFDDRGLPEFNLPPSASPRPGLTPEKVQTLYNQLAPYVVRLREGQDSVKNTRDCFVKLGPKVGAPKIADDLKAQWEHTERVLATWDTFERQMIAAKANGRICERDVPCLAEKLRALQADADKLAGLKASKEFFAYVCDELYTNLRGDVEDMEDSLTKGALDAFNKFDQAVLTLRTGEGSAENVAKLLGLIKPVVQEIKKAKKGTNYLDAALKAYGVSEASTQPGDPNMVLTRQRFARILDGKKLKSSADPIVAAKEMRTTLDQGPLTASVVSGPIRKEVMQALTTGEAINTIMNPWNSYRWRTTFSKAESVGNTGNHNALIYFENMARPVLKNSMFDPTKFIVADGLLFRKAFAAASSIYGLPGGNPLGSGKGVVPNVHTLGAQRQLADRNTKAVQDSITKAVDGATKRQTDFNQKVFDDFTKARKDRQDANASLASAEELVTKADQACKDVDAAVKAAKSQADAAIAAADEAQKATGDPNTVKAAQTAAEKAAGAITSANAAVSAADAAATSAKTAKVPDDKKNAIEKAGKDITDSKAQMASDPKQAKNAAKKIGEAAKGAADAVTAAVSTAKAASDAATKARKEPADKVVAAKATFDGAAKAKADYISGVRKAMLLAAADLEGASSRGN